MSILNPGDKMDVTVSRKKIEAEGIVSIELAPLDGTLLPPFDAGAHIDIHLEGGITRQYSLCNAPGEQHRYLLGVLLDANSRGGSKAVHGLLQTGQKVQIGAPRNNFPLNKSAQESILIAGGIGITPMLSMAHALSREKRQFTLHCCVRDLSRLPFQQLLQSEGFAENVVVHNDSAGPESAFDHHRDVGNPVVGKHLYVCGPAGFMRFVMDGARQLGWLEENIHGESFTPAAVASGGAFIVKAERSGIEVLVKSGETIAQALIEAGVPVSLSCEQGMCGTCLTTVLSGEPDHKDTFLTDKERSNNDCITVCCSRAKSPSLTLDI